MLGFWGYKYDVKILLSKLSKKSRAYLYSHHRPLLDHSLVVESPQRSSYLKFSKDLRRKPEKSPNSKVGFSFTATYDFAKIPESEAGESATYGIGGYSLFTVKKHTDTQFEISFLPTKVLST